MLINKDAKEDALISKDTKIDNGIDNNERMLGSQVTKYKSLQLRQSCWKKLQTASNNCKEEGRFSLTWPNKKIRFHVAWLSPFSWDRVNICSFKRIFLIEFNITWRKGLVGSNSSKTKIINQRNEVLSDFLELVCFRDEENSHFSGHVKKQIMRYCTQNQPHDH